MKKKIIIIILLGIFNLGFLNAQRKTLDDRFRGGEKKFTEIIIKNITYPINSRQNRTIGYSIASISVNSKGNIDTISIINPIDENIDNVVINAIKKTNDRWKKEDAFSINQTFYVQIVFSIVGISSNNVDVKNPVSEMYGFVDPIILTAMSIKSENLPESNNSIAAKCNIAIKENNYEDALIYISELIKRNPFNRDFYQLRIMISSKINRRDFILKDSEKLNNFIPGVPLKKLLTNN